MSWTFTNKAVERVTTALGQGRVPGRATPLRRVATWLGFAPCQHTTPTCDCGRDPTSTGTIPSRPARVAVRIVSAVALAGSAVNGLVHLAAGRSQVALPAAGAVVCAALLLWLTHPLPRPEATPATTRR